jgi:hypothetical protein
VKDPLTGLVFALKWKWSSDHDWKSARAGDIMILWTKVDQDNTMIAMGSSILPESYRARTAVDISAKGSVLTIGAARPEDGGQYKCSLALPDQRPQEIIHTVTIRGIK